MATSGSTGLSQSQDKNEKPSGSTPANTSGRALRSRKIPVQAAPQSRLHTGSAQGSQRVGRAAARRGKSHHLEVSETSKSLGVRLIESGK